MAERVQVREIDDDEGRRLLRIARRGTGSVVTWRRAQMVLLSAQGMSVAKIAEVTFTSADRVRDVIHDFNTDGLANILRTDMHAHRPLPADSDLARAITVLARAQQDAVWHRQQLVNQVRSLLKTFYPAALDAFQGKQHGLARPEARAVLATSPTPARAAKLSLPQFQAALRRAGRVRGIEAEARRLREVFRGDYARQPQAVEDAMGCQLAALIVQLDAACRAADQLAQAVEESFRKHPDAEVLLSFPGLGVQLGARVLAVKLPLDRGHLKTGTSEPRGSSVGWEASTRSGTRRSSSGTRSRSWRPRAVR